MRELAASPYGEAAAVLPKAFATLDYDGYRKIQFRPERARWAGSAAGYQVQAFAPGWLYTQPVAVYEVIDGVAQPFDFVADDFQYYDAAVGAEAEQEGLPGVAGFRINYPLNAPDRMDELIAFLGASYFRALGRENIYGLSARGVVVDSWRQGPEEFPRFSEFYLERPTAPGQPLVLHAALDSTSLTGAYRFELTPASASVQSTLVEVTARLFFRKDIDELGIAPLTSMFLYADANRSGFDDYRPEVHDSDGLLIDTADGERQWRPLNNAPVLGNSYLWNNEPRAFGLYQRHRAFENYEDAYAHYERRPSVRVEPIGGWGQGSVRLIEVPAQLEADDNIVAFWVPSEPAKAGGEQEFRYRLIWGDLEPEPDFPLAPVVDTRSGRGGVSGVQHADSLRKFVIDFKGGALDDWPDGPPPDALVNASSGKIASSVLSKVPASGVWRLAIDLETDGPGPIELKAYLVGHGRTLTETWLYQWRAAA